MSIVLPLPPVDCKQNTHKHWRQKGAAIKLYRQEAMLLTMAAKPWVPFAGPVVVSHEWFMHVPHKEQIGLVPKRYRPLDIGNAIGALKAAIDGIVDAGLIPGDSHKVLKWGEGVLHRSANEHGGRSCVVLTFETIEGGA
jgi:hypothetical protein